MNYMFLVAALLGQQPVQPTMGHLLIVGGGAMPPEILQKALDLSGGKKANIVIMPQASAVDTSGPREEQMWRQAGAEQVTVLDFTNLPATIAAIKKADMIWLPGGSQNRLMDALKQQQGIIDTIRERFNQGITVAGTSAGAAVMSLIMLTGEADLSPIADGVTKTAEGLGLWPEVIIDQHYLRRYRFNRLLNAVLDHPSYVGIGIDEATAVVVDGRHFEVIGKSNVIVIDARKALRMQSKEGEPGAAAYVSLQVLKAGMRFHLDKGLLSDTDVETKAAASGGQVNVRRMASVP